MVRRQRWNIFQPRKNGPAAQDSALIGPGFGAGNKNFGAQTDSTRRAEKNPVFRHLSLAAHTGMNNFRFLGMHCSQLTGRVPGVCAITRSRRTHCDALKFPIHRFFDTHRSQRTGGVLSLRAVARKRPRANRWVSKNPSERVGFEPTVPLRVQRFSRPSLSATQAPLQTTPRDRKNVRKRGELEPEKSNDACGQPGFRPVSVFQQTQGRLES